MSDALAALEDPEVEKFEIGELFISWFTAQGSGACLPPVLCSKA